MLVFFWGNCSFQQDEISNHRCDENTRVQAPVTTAAAASTRRRRRPGSRSTKGALPCVERRERATCNRRISTSWLLIESQEMGAVNDAMDIMGLGAGAVGLGKGGVEVFKLAARGGPPVQMGAMGAYTLFVPCFASNTR